MNKRDSINVHTLRVEADRADEQGLDLAADIMRRAAREIESLRWENERLPQTRIKDARTGDDVTGHSLTAGGEYRLEILLDPHPDDRRSDKFGITFTLQVSDQLHVAGPYVSR
tara:strand:+ start:28191 stop:28529 length:339 start_codon:yes stop_codon:yes gene_type:complete